MVPKEVVTNADVSGVFRGRVIIRQVDAWFVVLANNNWSLNKLTRDGLDDVDDPKKYAGDEREGHVFRFSGAECDCRLQFGPERNEIIAEEYKISSA